MKLRVGTPRNLSALETSRQLTLIRSREAILICFMKQVRQVPKLMKPEFSPNQIASVPQRPLKLVIVLSAARARLLICVEKIVDGDSVAGRLLCGH